VSERSKIPDDKFGVLCDAAHALLIARERGRHDLPGNDVLWQNVKQALLAIDPEIDFVWSAASEAGPSESRGPGSSAAPVTETEVRGIFRDEVSKVVSAHLEEKDGLEGRIKRLEEVNRGLHDSIRTQSEQTVRIRAALGLSGLDGELTVVAALRVRTERDQAIEQLEVRSKIDDETAVMRAAQEIAEIEGASVIKERHRDCARRILMAGGQGFRVARLEQQIKEACTKLRDLTQSGSTDLLALVADAELEVGSEYERAEQAEKRLRAAEGGKP